MNPKVLVCAYSEVQFKTLLANVAFFHLARSREVVKRIYTPGDLIGLAPSTYLFALPDWTKSMNHNDAHTIVHYWTDNCKNQIVEVTEEQVIGKVPFVPPADAPWSNLYRPKQYVDRAPHNTFPDFPRYFGRKEREVPDDFHQQFQQEPIMPTGPQRVTASGKVVDA